MTTPALDELLREATARPWCVGGPHPHTSVCYVRDYGDHSEPPVWEAICDHVPGADARLIALLANHAEEMLGVLRDVADSEDCYCAEDTSNDRALCLPCRARALLARLEEAATPQPEGDER